MLTKLNKAAVEAMRDADVKAKLASQGVTLIGDSPDEFRTFLESEIKKWANVIKEAGVPTEK